MASVEQGLEALRSGNYGRAVEVFDTQVRANPSSAAALAGLAEAQMMTGRLSEAQATAQRALDHGSTAGAEALMGEILGRLGHRAEGERHATRAVSMEPNVSFYQALLGEQQIRQGRWQDGTETMVRALNAADDGRGFAHVQCVVADMVDAIIAGRIPETDGMRFVNRLDYTIPNKTQEMAGFFALARRSMHSGQSLPRPARSAGAAVTQSQPQAQAGAQRQRQAPAAQPQRQQQQARVANPAPAQHQQARVPSAAPTQQRKQETRQTGEGQPTSNRANLVSRLPGKAARPMESRPEAGQKNMVEIMQEERRLNEGIQNMVPPAVPPQWPSESDDPIDRIPAVGFDKHNILGGSGGSTAADFRLTGGDIIVEIVLERCMHNLLAATLSNKASAVPFRPSSIARLELNFRDGLLETLSPLNALYLEEVKVDNDRVLALGRFLGECVVQSFGGVWAYEHPPNASFIRLGRGATLRPFELAAEWIAAEDIDDVNLDSIIGQAERAVADSAMLSTVVDYIDPTPGLEGSALCMKLAELWIAYRFSMNEADLSEVAASIRPVAKDSRTVLFAIDQQWVPASGRGPNGSGVNAQGEVAMAYVRSTGEFLLLASRKHFARYVGYRWGKLENANAQAVVDLLDTAHRPGWRVVNSDALANDVNQRLKSTEVSGPRIAAGDAGADLFVWTFDGTRLHQYQLRHARQDLVTWQLRVARTIVAQ
ncbi:MAG: tetratricopeptide repeat protein [Bradymonadaceae bacterium]|nr:tetratricopeptide repeat protein [Lujinxingiaceae bacterium]